MGVCGGKKKRKKSPISSTKPGKRGKRSPPAGANGVGNQGRKKKKGAKNSVIEFDPKIRDLEKKWATRGSEKGKYGKKKNATSTGPDCPEGKVCAFGSQPSWTGPRGKNIGHTSNRTTLSRKKTTGDVKRAGEPMERIIRRVTRQLEKKN